MFYAIIPDTPATFAVQPDDPQLNAAQAAELIGRLEKHFMHPISIVAWDRAGKFVRYGRPVSEEIVANEDLLWREFELPPEAGLPF